MSPVENNQLLAQGLLVCPVCHGSLVLDNDGFSCGPCARRYPIDDSIPIFVDQKLSDHDELDHLTGHGRSANRDRHKAEQAAYFDRQLMAEFELERPWGAPPFYRFLLLEKFRRAVRPLGRRLDGWTALTICGGSGMDAEFLVRAGASVVSSDISLEAAKRTRERARRHGVVIASIVADAEHLPFRDQSMDLVFVHDGLHHLEDPDVGLSEMARVARRAVSISEPAKAAATAFAARLGLARLSEESGNIVARLDPIAAARLLEDAGFLILRRQRYAMYYRHHPGRLFAFVSRPWLFGIAKRTWRAANVVLGRVGNKLAIVAERRL